MGRLLAEIHKGTTGDDSPISWCGKRSSGTTGRAPSEHHTGPRCCRRCGARCEIVDCAYRPLAGCILVAGLALPAQKACSLRVAAAGKRTFGKCLELIKKVEPAAGG